MSQVDDIRHFIQDCLDNQVKTLNWLEKYGPNIIRALVPTHVGIIPVPPGVRDLLADFYIWQLQSNISYARKVNAAMQTMLPYLGSPDALRSAAASLGAKVSGKAKDYATVNLREGSLEAMSDPTQWSGPGSFQYAKSFDGQSLAFSRISEFSARMEDALTQMAKNIEDYYNGLRDAVIALILVIAGIVAALVGWETIIVGIIGIVVAIIGIVQLVIALVDLSHDQTLSTKEMFEDLNSIIFNWPATNFGSA